MTILAPILGFAVTVTLAYLVKCVYVYTIVMNSNEARSAPKKARMEYRIGMATLIGAAAITFMVVCWVIGRALVGVL